MRANDGGDRLQRDGAVWIVDLADAAVDSAGRARELAGWQVRMAQWSKSADLYAIVLKAGAAPNAVRPTVAIEVAALTSLCWRIECFAKPSVALLDTALSGAAISLTTLATHRVGGHGYRFAVPRLSARAGLPVAGVAHALARLPGAAGMYLALTGQSIGAADALALGLLTHTIAADAYGAIIAAVADSQPVDAVLDMVQADFGMLELAPHAAAIARCFSAPSVAGVVANLAAETDAEADWARATLAMLQRQSAADLSAIHQILTRAAACDLRESLIAAHRAAVEFSGPAGQINLDNNSVDFSLPTRAEIAIGRF